MTAQKNQASTQKFTEIIDFDGNIVVMTGGNACVIIELTASNFSLLSKREQDSRIYAYASLLNSLSFPIQILIRNKKMDITSYLKELDQIIASNNNEFLARYIEFYRDFVQNMVSVNSVLSKSFYVIIPYSSLEQGASTVIQNNKSQAESFAKQARNILEEKALILLSQLQRFSVTAKILDRENLIKLFYDIYNEGDKINDEDLISGVRQTIVKGEPT